MVRILIFAAVVSVALTIYTLIECARADNRSVRSLPKPAWFAVIILLPLIGAGLWFILGRPVAAQAATATKSMAPDDDEDFLRQLEVWRRQQQREAEAAAREQELKDGEQKPKPETKRPAKPEATEPTADPERKNKSEGTENGPADTETP